jgi:hypothetical protein
MEKEAAVRQEALQCIVNTLEALLSWYKVATGQGEQQGAADEDAEEVVGQMVGVVR